MSKKKIVSALRINGQLQDTILFDLKPTTNKEILRAINKIVPVSFLNEMSTKRKFSIRCDKNDNVSFSIIDNISLVELLYPLLVLRYEGLRKDIIFIDNENLKITSINNVVYIIEFDRTNDDVKIAIISDDSHGRTVYPIPRSTLEYYYDMEEDRYR